MTVSDRSNVPSLLDLRWMGRPQCIGVWLIGDVLVDCGPRTRLEGLIEQLGDWRPRALLLTHIHFDHAGAAGALVERWPDLEVWVHRRGAGHLVSPERLEHSARRVFGAEFDQRYGSLTPIPARNVHPLDGGEDVHGMRTLATPGHASHHLAFLHESGWAFVGDVAGVRLRADGALLLPTPPPDIDLDLWCRSVDRVAAWQPEALALAHFGAVPDATSHLESVREAISRQRELIHSGATCQEYIKVIRAELAKTESPALVDDYELTVPLAQNHAGLHRWRDKHATVDE